MTTPDDNFYAEDIVKANPRVRALITEKYGISEAEMDEVLICDTWALHNAPPHLNHRRLMQGFLYLKLKGARSRLPAACAPGDAAAARIWGGLPVCVLFLLASYRSCQWPHANDHPGSGLHGEWTVRLCGLYNADMGAARVAHMQARATMSTRTHWTWSPLSTSTRTRWAFGRAQHMSTAGRLDRWALTPVRAPAAGDGNRR